MKSVQTAYVFLCFAGGLLHAQEFRGTFSGTVKDARGAAIPRAKVTAVAVSTGVTTTTLTETSGAYAIPFLQPGEYTLRAEAPAFKVAVRQGLTLSTGEHPVIDFELEVGDTSQAVTVTAEVPLVESYTASTGQVITTDEVEDFPLNGLTPLMLGRL